MKTCILVMFLGPFYLLGFVIGFVGRSVFRGLHKGLYGKSLDVGD